MKNSGSLAWLIIFLCAIVFGLYTAWGYNWHLRQTADLRQQIESLKNKISELEKEQQAKKEILPSFSPLATPSAKPSLFPLPKSKSEATNSGKIKEEE